MLAILDAYRLGLLKPKNWMPNIISGIIVGIVALPLAMAFAIASGVKPEQGLYTAIVAAFFVAVFGGSQVQIAGPTGAFIVILADITAQYGVEGLQLATLIAGFMLILMSLIKLGTVIKFIPDPVIVGFTAGIGVIIFVGQWKDFFGLTAHYALDVPFYHKLLTLIKAFPTINWNTTGLAILGLVLTLVTPKFFKKIPGPLVAMILVTVLQSVFQFKQVATLGTTFGSLPQYLPSFHLPNSTMDEVIKLIDPAFTIALLGAIESLLSATAADGMAGTKHNSNQELFGQGLANIFAPLFGGFAATGAIARTAVNVRNGGNCGIAAIVHSIFLILVILFLAPLASAIPLCVLSAILFVVAYNMSDIPHFMHIIRCAPRSDVFVLLATFLLTVFADLVIAVNAGVILAMLFFIRRMIQAVKVEKQTPESLKLKVPKDIIVYTIQGPFFFGAAEKLEHSLAFTHTDPKTIIFRLKDVPFMDMTGLETFDELIEEYHKRGVKVYLCEANTQVIRKLAAIGTLHWVEQERVFNTLSEVLSGLNLQPLESGEV